jgi:hypothetical protein
MIKQDIIEKSEEKRELSMEDMIFLKFSESNDRAYINELMRLSNPLIFAIIFSFIKDKEETENILDEIWLEFVKNTIKYDVMKRGIVYEIYLLARDKFLERF